jgi:hypothetical protein
MGSQVLLVEDETLLARNVKTFLERRDYQVSIADTIRAATALYDEIKPDVVLIDQNLPDGVGMDLIRSIRSRTIIWSNPSLSTRLLSFWKSCWPKLGLSSLYPISRPKKKNAAEWSEYLEIQWPSRH